jgi:hypothetical protein
VVTIEIEGAFTQRSVLDAIESRYPMLGGSIREHNTQHYPSVAIPSLLF